MDLLTQGLLGASLAQGGARREEVRQAAGIGFLAGILADADALIRSNTDPLLVLEYHRHFTHSVFFIPLGALIAALLLWPFVCRRLKFLRLYWFCLLGYSLSGVLDAFTSYGTHLFWPVSQDRISWHMIAIVDPVFSSMLLIGGVLTFKYRRSDFAKVGLVLCAGYLALAGLQLTRAEAAIAELIRERGHLASKILVKPTLGNIILWRSIYEYRGVAYVDVVRVGLQFEPRVFEVGSIKLLDVSRDFPGLTVDSALFRDINRFAAFSDGYMALHPTNPRIIGDVRYANSPGDIKPLWGIEFDLAKPGEHAAYRFYRDLGEQNRRSFLNMLFHSQDVD